MKSAFKILAAGLVGIALSGASALAQSVTVDYDHSVNFMKFKTYTWDKVHATDPGVEDRITIALNRDMAGRYMSEVPKGGDVTITAVEGSQSPDEFTTFYNSLGSDYSWQRPWGNGFLDSQASPSDVPVNTLVIDMYDTKTHKLLWRGTVTGPLTGSQDKMNNTIDKEVTELISKYPPKYKK